MGSVNLPPICLKKSNRTLPRRGENVFSSAGGGYGNAKATTIYDFSKLKLLIKKITFAFLMGGKTFKIFHSPYSRLISAFNSVSMARTGRDGGEVTASRENSNIFLLK